MVVPRKPSPDKSAKYAISASKGFSYYLPKSAQQHLQQLLRQLPSTARSVYDEYYRDIMCAKACAPESAVALASFVTQSFPVIARKHNAFAKELNEEIESDEHEEDVAAASKGKKRKRPTAATKTLPFRKATPSKKVKLEADELPAPEPTSPPPSSPDHTADSEVPLSTQPHTTVFQASIDTARDPDTDAASPPNPDSDHGIDAKKGAASDRPNWQSRDGSPPSYAPPSEVLGTEDHISELQNNFQSEQEDSISKPNASPVDVETNAPGANAPMLSPAVSLPDVLPSEAPTTLDLVEPEQDKRVADNDNEPDDVSSELDFESLSEEQSWADGAKAIEAFRWDRRGSLWKPGRGLVSIYYSEVGESAGLFRGNHWAEEEDSMFTVQATDALADCDVSMGEALQWDHTVLPARC